MNKYTFRVDMLSIVSREETENRIEKCLSRYPKYLISLEVADKSKKLHYQGIVHSDDLHRTYQEHCKSFFKEWKGERGKKGPTSFAQVRNDNYEVYITKDHEYYLSKGYTDEEIEVLHEKSYKKNEVSRSDANNDNVPVNSANKRVTDSLIKTIYNSIPDKERAKKWTELGCAQYVQYWYDNNTKAKSPYCHYGRMLAEGLYRRLSVDTTAYIRRTAEIAYDWFKGHPMIDEGSFKHACNNRDIKLPNWKWDDIEKEEVIEIDEIV